MKVLGIIPARYASTRFPGKPLVDIKGKPMIQHVYENAVETKLFSKVVVATDDDRILKVVENFNGNAMMTSEEHQSGTDRCGEVIERLGEEFDIVVNIQGDEPFLVQEQLELLIKCFENPNADIATLKLKLNDTNEIFNPNVVKVVSDVNDKAIYFSRNPIPFVRSLDQKDWIKQQIHYVHIGLYGYRYSVLKQLVQLKPSILELNESLEQLRWIENGYAIFIKETKHHSIGIDTPEDLKKLNT